MNIQAHMSGQISGQVPNQAGNQLSGLPQQNGNTFHTQVQNLGGQNNPSVMEPEVIKMRHFMRNKIYDYLLRRSSHPDTSSKRMQDICRRLEEGLFKSATTKEDYMNVDTLESRIHAIIKRPAHHQQAPQHPQFVGNSTPIGTMIPTPGMQQNGNSNMMVSSAMDPSAITSGTASMPSTGRLTPTATGSFSGMRGGALHASEGSLSNGYQQSPSSFSINSNVNNMMAGQRVASQMIPTPGFSSSSNQAVTNVDNMGNGVLFSGVDSSVVPQQVSQRHIGGQNSHVLQNIGSAMNSGMRSLMQQRFRNGSLNSGFGNNIQMVNVSGPSDNYLTPSSFGASRPLQQPFDQHPLPLGQGDGYRLATADSSGTGNLSNAAAPMGSLISNQNMNQLRSQSSARSSQVSVQSSTPGSQPASYVRPQLAEQVDKLNFQSSQSPRESHSQSSMKQYQAHAPQLDQQQQFVAYRQHKQSSQLEQAFVRTDGFVQSQMAPGISNHVKSEYGLEHQNEVLQSQLSAGQFQLPEVQSQFQQNSNGNPPRNPQISSVSSGSQGISSPLLQHSQQMMSGVVTNEYNSLPIGAQEEALLHAQWHPESDRSSLAGNLSHEQHVHEDFRQRIVGHDEAQRNNMSSEVSTIAQSVPSKVTVDPSKLGGAPCNTRNVQRERQFKNQQRWLLFLRHARWCKAPEGKCQDSHCSTVQKLLRHMDSCTASRCMFPRCLDSKRLMHHHKHCRDPSCPVCVPVKNFIRSQVKVITRPDSESQLPGAAVSCKSSETAEVKTKDTSVPSETIAENSENLQPSLKRLKAEPPPQSARTDSGSMLVSNRSSLSHGCQDVKPKEFEKHDNLEIKSECADIKTEISGGSNLTVAEVKNVIVDPSPRQRVDGAPVSNDSGPLAKEENVKIEKESNQMKPEEGTQPSEQGAGTKSGKPKIKGVSLTELFTPEQVREHIRGLRQWVGQSKAKAEKNQAMEHSMSENSCQLCAVEKLTFEPPPIYCTPCGARIKRNAMYYTVGAGDTRHYICIPCYNEARGDTIVIEGTTISKSRLEKKKNDEETEEWWVQCDKCEAWQHQICALFNGRRNDGGQAEYTCPYCYMQEVERGERKPLPRSAVLGAKDLPKTILSDHIEQRLAKRLKHERQERARAQGKSLDEVPGADGIVVRVVSSVDKKLDVKPRFLEIFREENYPTEFPYKSKVVLLFQEIEGVEVCLFGMYVQEFGSECQPPNQRRVYLSYLDSVKYFRPEVKTVTGEALRTFVYHEILIGYLEYCKLRGFTSCYIWACPPLKGEDYILYCHPEIQKTPKSDKLREWYLAMLRKAARENIVVELTNLYDHFFVQTGECRAKVTAARLPYFDGDYWPGAAEDMIYQINQEEEGRKLNKKGTTKKIITKRALKLSGQSDLSGNASKDLLLMHKLGETISPMKEDFIMVHLQHACTHCCWLMVSGNRWVCNQCKNFQLCDKCYEAEQKRDDRGRHPTNQKDKHSLYPVEITGVPEDTKDKDEILESEFFDTRQAFLSLCQGNHYQYDTLRRAKHSSMMVLYHLHNPTAPAFVTTCNVCHLDVETGQGWRCETCPDFDVCNACYQKDGGIDHPHKLTNHPSMADRDAQNKEARQLRVQQLRKMLDLLVHASQCRSPHCQYPNCRKVKGLFRHGIQCRVRASGGCVLCKKMWYLLQLHARACNKSECHVPRCRDLKEHLRRLQQQSDSRRRAAVMEMMRQRAAEVAGNNS